jgi:hypothetical protein
MVTKICYHAAVVCRRVAAEGLPPTPTPVPPCPEIACDLDVDLATPTPVAVDD